MPYSDNNPERRNLTFLSIAIIVYYLAGGQFLDGKVNLMLINAKFNDPSMLMWIVWVMLCWFLFRYNISNKNSHGILLEKERVEVKMDNWITRKYFESVEKPISKLKEPRAIFTSPNHHWCINVGPSGSVYDEDIELSGFKGYLVRIVYLLKISLKHKATTDYYTPFLLFWSAIGLGIYNYYWKSLC